LCKRRKTNSNAKEKRVEFFHGVLPQFDYSVLSLETGHFKNPRVFRNYLSVKIPYYFQNFKSGGNKPSSENHDMHLEYAVRKEGFCR